MIKKCSFCNNSGKIIDKLFKGDNAYICDRCVKICNDVLIEEANLAKLSFDKTEMFKKTPKPTQIKKYLDEYVIGHEKAKKRLAVSVYNHYKRISCSEEDGVEFEKSNVLLVGPTGSGKTLLARTLARILNVPFAICDATTLTEAGYVGDDVENVLLRLLQEANFDAKKAETGIIYIDEIDKIGKTQENVSITRDVSGEGVQQALLKILEGTTASISPHGGRKHPQANYIQINTKDILFICGGTFTNIDKIIERRLGRKIIGFGAETTVDKKLKLGKILEYIEPQDLLKFGMIPEFVGRLPIISTLANLTKKELTRILLEPKNAIVKQYIKFFEMEGVKLTFAENVFSEIVETAVNKGTGARGLRSILEETMLEIMYDLPAIGEEIQECIITPECIKHKKEPVLIQRKKIA